MDWAPRVKTHQNPATLPICSASVSTMIHCYRMSDGTLCALCRYRYSRRCLPRRGVPCPKCSTKVTRRIDPLFSKGEGGTHEHWFRCPHCDKRLLWRDCRQALRNVPRCFDCRTVLQKEVVLRCACGETWTQEAYKQSVRTRVLLPCPALFWSCPADRIHLRWIKLPKNGDPNLS